MRSSDQQSVDQTVSRKVEPRAWPMISRGTLYALPFLTTLVIAYAVFVVGAPTSYQGARLWGGPTEDVQDIRLRLQAVERYHEVERALPGVPITVRAVRRGQVVGSFHGRTDSGGFSEVSLQLPSPVQTALELQVTSGERLLLKGSGSLARDEWLRMARRRGGWIRSRNAAGLRIRVRPGRGVFAVPFSDPLVVEVSDAGEPVAGARVQLRPEGALATAGKGALRTDEQGLSVFSLTPSEHVVTLGIRAEIGERHAEWYSTLPVVPGALHAVRRGHELHIASAIPREEAFFSVVNERARLFGGRVELTPGERGGARASVKLPHDLDGPLWAVVSSEPDMNAHAAVGWPLAATAAETFDAPDVLLFDGLPAAYEQSRQRPRRARQLAALFALFSLVLAGVIVAVRVRSVDRELAGRFHGLAPEEPRRFVHARPVLALLTALLCIALGFIVVALIALARIE